MSLYVRSPFQLAWTLAMTAQNIVYKGSCHCGTVNFAVNLPNGFETIRRCNCSYCSMRGAVMILCKADDLSITAGSDNLTLYEFHSRTAKHYFCKTCGIYTHHQRRSDLTQFGLNVACIEGISPFDFASVEVSNGKDHPSDTGNTPRIAGTLRYVASK